MDFKDKDFTFHAGHVDHLELCPSTHRGLRLENEKRQLVD